ncbi:MAG TPA: Trp biosynthesis protein, partial [Pilimelia sp.]|nr:Trp biosynthesis protein [Pilimelia sp.]
MPATGPAGRRSDHQGRRLLAYAVVLCLAGAGLALLAATRAWTLVVEARPAPLPPVRAA